MTTPDTTDVRVFLRGVGTGIRFVIRNMGSANARDVHFEIDSQTGKNSPLVSSEVESKIPIAELAPDEECELAAVVTTGTGIEFNARLAWRNPDDSERRIEALLAV